MANLNVHPLFHSDRGYQLYQQGFSTANHQSWDDTEYVACGSMEGFWGLIKREMHYTRKYQMKDELIKSIHSYMDYYTNGRVQRRLGMLTPIEYHEQMLLTA